MYLAHVIPSEASLQISGHCWWYLVLFNHSRHRPNHLTLACQSICTIKFNNKCFDSRVWNNRSSSSTKYFG
ncbi:hypothetical protein M378DRAFT_523628 [Amanita muscaria Koide BX008]|uniref:Uncharacterized protein n=1 Tax=Amanita muscaria (strain Koide BX008) TaxID=946122 RepID=A0A0C2SQW0_AMAMK|nr:hypothetical protein M378DRAFT_523628 [Amanita muscaria Koide BX008]